MIAFTTNPNTPETDAQPFVLHTVEWTENGIAMKQTLKARDPFDAAERIKKQRRKLKGLL